jgi:signal transduction histidine kinase
MVKEIASLHGGDVSVKSAPGEGSTFTLRIPLESDI